MRQLDVLARRHLELNQADIIVTGDNARARTRCQNAFDARGTLIRRVATPQLQIDIAPGNGLQRTGVQNWGCETCQLTGFVQTQ
ncbi:hypothetical protein D3C78_940990 [compost metagenome]